MEEMDASKFDCVTIRREIKKKKEIVDYEALVRLINESIPIRDTNCEHSRVAIRKAQLRSGDEIEVEFANCETCGEDVKYKSNI